MKTYTAADFQKWGAQGGAKSKRTLTSLQARQMVAAREIQKFLRWFNKSQWADAGKDAGELARAAWEASKKTKRVTRRANAAISDTPTETSRKETK